GPADDGLDRRDERPAQLQPAVLKRVPLRGRMRRPGDPGGVVDRRHKGGPVSRTRWIVVGVVAALVAAQALFTTGAGAAAGSAPRSSEKCVTDTRIAVTHGAAIEVPG